MSDEDIVMLAMIRQVLDISDKVSLADVLSECRKIKEIADHAIVCIGDFRIYRNRGYLWITHKNHDAMAMNPDTEKKFEQMILEFFKENF